MDVHLRNIRKQYARSKEPSLDLDDLLIRGGETHGILGHSGSGKSTLLNLLALLDRPDPGQGAQLTFYPYGTDKEGFRWAAEKSDLPAGVEDIKDDDGWRRRYFSFVFQSGYLLGNFSVLDNVLMPLRLRGSVGKDGEDRAKAVLEKIGIGQSKWRSLPHQLSGGEYQRVAVARSVVHEPRIVFADEPTGSLDPKWGKEAMKALHKWLTDGNGSGNLLILVTHNVDHVMQYCDTVTVLRGGKVVEHGATRELGEAAIRAAMTQHETEEEPKHETTLAA